MAHTINIQSQKLSLKEIDLRIRDYKIALKHWKRKRHLYLTNPKRFYQERNEGALISSQHLRKYIKLMRNVTKTP